MPAMKQANVEVKACKAPDTVSINPMFNSKGNIMKHVNKLILAVAIGASLGLASLAYGQQADAPHAHAHEAMSEGEIKNVDKAGGKLTIKHGELKNVGMPGMTMVFKVKDLAMLDQVKQGDTVKFVADKVNGALTVTAIEVAK